MTIARLEALDLCAGAGGMSLGLAAAGFDVHGVEIDADAVATHRAMVGPCDRSEVECWRPWGGARAALVAGGVPCTTFSAAGNREGMRDPRGLLYRHLLRVAVECDAPAVLLENVEGLVNWRDATGTALRILEAAYREHGYEPIARVLCAADYGVPQKRYRLFVVGFRDPEHAAAFRWPEPTHAEPGSLFGLPSWVTVRQALRLGGGAYASGLMPQARSTRSATGQRRLVVDEPATVVSTSRGTEWLDVLDAKHGLAERPSTTVTQRGDVPPAGNHARQKKAARLTDEQCAALQGFPPGFVFCGNKTSRHAQIGNACPPALAEHVGRAVVQALGIEVVRADVAVANAPEFVAEVA